MARALFPIVLGMLAAGIAACSPEQEAASGPDGGVQVADALCRPTPNGRHTTGCYLTLTASADDRLIAVASPVASRVQVHESRMESNMMMMRELRDGLPLPAGQPVELKPGGNHLMLLGVTEPLKAGDSVPLTLTFASARPFEITATVGQPATTEYGAAAH